MPLAPEESFCTAVAGGVVTWPPYCAACSGAAQTELKVTGRRPGKARPLGAKAWLVPYCFACLHEVRAGHAGAAVLYDERPDGADSFLFWNAEYGELFARANASQRVNR
jgi:hypothetical protein